MEIEHDMARVGLVIRVTAFDYLSTAVDGSVVIIVEIEIGIAIEIEMQRFDSNHITFDSDLDFDPDLDLDLDGSVPGTRRCNL